MAGPRFDEIEGEDLPAAPAAAPRFDEIEGEDLPADPALANVPRGTRHKVHRAAEFVAPEDQGSINPLNAVTGGAVDGLSMGHAPQILAAGHRALGAVGSTLGIDKIADDRSYDEQLVRARNLLQATKDRYPKLTFTGDLGGSMFGFKKIGEGVGALRGAMGGAAAAAPAASGAINAIKGYAGRVGKAGLVGGLMGGARASGESEADFGSEQHLKDTGSGAAWGAGAGAVLQGAVAEPIKGIAGYIGGKISGANNELRARAQALIDEAIGKRGKQAQEAIGGARNINHARLQGAQLAPAGQAAQQGAVTLPASTGAGGMGGNVTQLARPRPAPVAGPPASPASHAAMKVGNTHMRDLERRGLDNAVSKIRDEALNPIQVPSMGQASADALRGMDAEAKAQALKGLGAIGTGALGAKIGGPVGAIVGAGGLGYGAREMARALFKSPTAMNKLSFVPKYGPGLAKAAQRGGQAFELALYAALQDPEAKPHIEAAMAEGELRVPTGDLDLEEPPVSTYEEED